MEETSISRFLVVPALLLASVSFAQAPKIVKKKEYQGLRALAFAPAPTGSRVAVTLENSKVIILDANTGQTLKTLEGHPQPAQAVAWSPDGTMIATGDDSARIMVWDTKSWKRTRLIYGEHQRPISDLSFNAASTLLLSTGADDKGTVWNLKDGKLAGRILGNGANLYSMTFAPSGTQVLAATLTASARKFNFSGGFSAPTFLTGHDTQGFLDIAWSPDGTRAISGGKDGTAHIWDIKTMKSVARLRGHQDWVMQVAFSPNGLLAATSSPDRTVKVWNMKGFAKIADLPDQRTVGSPLAFTADGKYLLTSSINDYMTIYTITPPQPKPAPAKAPAKKKGRG